MTKKEALLLALEFYTNDFVFEVESGVYEDEFGDRCDTDKASDDDIQQFLIVQMDQYGVVESYTQQIRLFRTVLPVVECGDGRFDPYVSQALGIGCASLEYFRICDPMPVI